MPLAEVLAILMVLAVIAALMAGYQVALTLAGVSLIFALLGDAAGVMRFAILGALPQRIFGVMTNEVLLAIPLFIFMGVMLERSRIAEDLLETMGRLFGTLRGGLGISAVVVGTLLAAAKGDDVLGPRAAPLILEADVGQQAGPDAQTRDNKEPLLGGEKAPLPPAACLPAKEDRKHKASKIEDDKTRPNRAKPAKPCADEAGAWRKRRLRDPKIDFGKGHQERPKSHGHRQIASPGMEPPLTLCLGDRRNAH